MTISCNKKGYTYTLSGVQILMILVFDQECRIISRSRVPKRHAEVSLFFLESRSTTPRFPCFLLSPKACKMAKKHGVRDRQDLNSSDIARKRCR
jgi:hypothetical protein